ncbi:aminoglycoside phosphotransferase family protein [Nonomuraea composti]|uniref:phosphotransferase n=1 Tax=Nonomuraea composti TaxID=2720023 RepID=UPI001980B2F0|nr:aminoglycoside phosphotransferase family protein [Nonomuraea sp. FMUSA5-5]
MRDRPDDLDEELLRPALTAWGIEAATLNHAPVGFGDHHWIATGAGGRRWFVTVADARLRSYDELGRAMETAAALREEAGLGFVVAPLRAFDGATLRRLDGDRYAMSVFPYEEGTAGEFGDELPDADRGRLIDLLAELHTTPPPRTTPARPVELPGRAALEQALADTTLPWLGGPYSEPAQDLLASHAGTVRRRLAELDRLAARPGEPVLTHGEPHAGNVLRDGARLLLIDWDTVGTAAPERDLWLAARDEEDLARYTKATGRAVDRDLLALYRLRWALNDVAEFVAWFRAPHGRTADAEQSWDALTGTLQELAA